MEIKSFWKEISDKNRSVWKRLSNLKKSNKNRNDISYEDDLKRIRKQAGTEKFI